ncbi:GH13530 [Drosophila grimshawi]|uniref:GH13530 n=1 Tax=Drosophila grimshawi TaxID=7222 RepID=B4JPJ6_DROGR|nr:GH13530 [Drosophila grimshawi]
MNTQKLHESAQSHLDVNYVSLRQSNAFENALQDAEEEEEEEEDELVVQQQQQQTPRNGRTLSEILLKIKSKSKPKREADSTNTNTNTSTNTSTNTNSGVAKEELLSSSGVVPAWRP